jgi:hypothetical protein
MLSLLFVLAVLLGFIMKFLATWPVNFAERIAWGCWLLAAVLWAIGRVGLH